MCVCNYDYIKMCECVFVCVYCASRKQLDERRTPHPSNQAIVVLTENLLLLLVCLLCLCEWHQISVVMQCLHPGYFNVLLQVCVIDLLVSSSSSNNHHHHRIIIVIIIWVSNLIWIWEWSFLFCNVRVNVCVSVLCFELSERELYPLLLFVCFDYYWCICLVLRFTIAHTAEEERIIVTIDCRLRFVCGEVEVCIFSSFCFFDCLCVSNPFFRREPTLRFSWISRRNVNRLPPSYLYICMCSISRVPKCGQLVVRNLFWWLQSKFFFPRYCYQFCWWI